MDVKDSGKEVLEEAVEGTKDAIRGISTQLTEDWYKAQAKEKGALDIIQEKLISRKLLVFIVSTVLMWFGLDASTWGMIAMMYITGQSVIDAVKAWKWGG